MFDDCHLRLGQGPFAHCTPLTVSLLASLYALPARDDASLRGVLEAQASEQPWSASLAIAADQTTAAVGAMLRTVMLATSNLDSETIDVEAIPDKGRARAHLAALRDIWRAHPEVIPSDLAQLKDFLGAPADRALQSIAVIRDRDDPRLTLLERTVLERLEAHHDTVAPDDRDVIRLISGRKAAAAPATTLLGHVQRNLLDEKAAPANQDDSLCVLSVRDSLTESEAAAAMIQHWLDQHPSLSPAEIGVILPSNGDHALYLAETFDRAGLVASNLPMPAPRRNIGAEAVLHFVQCRRRPAPAMALASLYCSPVLCWSPEDGNAIAHGVMKGDFVPRHARTLAGKSALLFALIRAPAPRTTRQLKLQLRAFRRLLSGDPDLREDVLEAKVQIVRLLAALGTARDSAEPDWDFAVQFAAGYNPIPAERSACYAGGISVMLAHEAPVRRFKKLVLLGFNDGAYPPRPSGNPFFLDGETALIGDRASLALPSQASQLDRALALFARQLCASTEQVILLLSERDRNGATLAPSSSLPLIARLVAGCREPDKLIVPVTNGLGTIWDRLIAWQPRPIYRKNDILDIPVAYDLGRDLLTLRSKEDGSLAAQSPSRLEKLLVSPLAWLLAELGAVHVPWLPEDLDAILRGSLAHAVFELLFVPGTDHPDDVTIDERVPELLMDCIRTLAPFLQGSAWVLERKALEGEILKAARHWSRVLHALDAEIVGNEFWLSGDLFGHPVHGKADCLLRLPGGQPLMIDYKKSSSGMRRERLKKGWDLQVDLYRRMDVRVDERSSEDEVRIGETLGAWKGLPGVAYHTLNDGNLLVNGAGSFASAEVELIEGDIAANALLLIEARFADLRAGRLVTNTSADEAYFGKQASLGTYALEDSPLIAAFTRQDAEPSITVPENDDD